MFTIGEFARLGLVSVRMLRHYDAVGLLTPARVDPASGHRFYEAAQLSRLNRIVALKDLGFTLEKVRTILEERVTPEELSGMLRMRRAQLEAQVEADLSRLRQVAARLRTIEGEGRMPSDEVVVKRLEAVRVAELTATVPVMASNEIGPVIGPLYPELEKRLSNAGLAPAGPAIAYYTALDDGEGATVHACFPVNAGLGEHHDFAVVDLPAAERAAAIIHRGPMSELGPTIQALARWAEDNGQTCAGYAREVYLVVDDDPTQENWVTELQLPLTTP